MKPELIKDLAKRIVETREDEPVQLRFAELTATGTTVTIELAGSSISGVRRLSDYTPTLNDIVAVLQTGPTLLVIGKVA